MVCLHYFKPESDRYTKIQKTKSILLKQQEKSVGELKHMTCPSMLSARKSENSGGCKSSQGIGSDLKFEERTLERYHRQSSAANQTTTLSKKKRRYINIKQCQKDWKGKRIEYESYKKKKILTREKLECHKKGREQTHLAQKWARSII